MTGIGTPTYMAPEMLKGRKYSDVCFREKRGREERERRREGEGREGERRTE